MFEHVPSPSVPPPQPIPTTTLPSTPVSTQGRPKPLSQPLSAVPLADHAAMELFKRTGLSGAQKLLIVGLALVVIGALVGAGIWLFMELDPFSASKRGPIDANSNTTNTSNVNSDIPLQELDTDKDGIRDIDEKRYGTSADSSDTDGDGLSDYAEINQYHTKPTLADTDADGYDDKLELDNGYDPNGPGRLAQ